MKSVLRLVRPCVDDERAGSPVEHAEQRHFGGLARSGNAQIRPLLGPRMGEIGMRQRFRLVPEQEHDVTRFRLRLQERAPHAAARGGTAVLSECDAPAERPFLRSTTDKREGEIGHPVRLSISPARRGKVQFVRSASGADSRSSATDKAASAFTGAAPGGGRVFRADTPPRMKSLRHRRTVSSRTPKACAIRPLVHPAKVSKIARARSASARSRDPLNSLRARFSSSLAWSRDLPPIIHLQNLTTTGKHNLFPLASLQKLA